MFWAKKPDVCNNKTFVQRTKQPALSRGSLALRYHLRGENFDICADEYNQLSGAGLGECPSLGWCPLPPQ